MKKKIIQYFVDEWDTSICQPAYKQVEDQDNPNDIQEGKSRKLPWELSDNS